jgi:hypothetical protein
MLAIHASAAVIFPILPAGRGQMTSQELGDLYKAQPGIFPKNTPIENLKLTGAFRSYVIEDAFLKTAQTPNLELLISSNQDYTLHGIHFTNQWSYMVIRGTNMVEILTATLDAKNHWKMPGAFYSLSQPDPIWIAYQKALALPQVKKRDYEFRYLMIGLELRADWLHSETDDIIIPFPCAYATTWIGYQPYSFDETVKLLRLEYGKK